MGCGASNSNPTPKSDFILISEQYDRQARANFVSTVIPKEGNDYLAVIKALDLAAAHILVSKKRSEDSSQDKEKKNKNSSNSKFNQLLASRRVVQDEALGRTPRAKGGSSTKYSDSQSSLDNNGSPTHGFGANVAPHSSEALSSLPYNSKLCILRMIRHPISLVHYWQFLQYLDKVSAMKHSPNVTEIPQVDNALAQFKLTINENIPHQPITAEDSPYESVLLIFLQVDKLVRLGVVPPQLRNPFGNVVHCMIKGDSKDLPSGSLPTLDQFMGAEDSRSQGVITNPFPDNPVASKFLEIQRALCSQYVTQASVIRSHRLFYETVLNQAQGILHSFCILNPIVHINNFPQDKLYSPFSLKKALSTVLSQEVIGGITHSLQNFIHTITQILNAVIAIDDQHALNLRILEDFERRGGFTEPNATGLVFNVVPNDGYYLDLDLYKLYVQSSYTPASSEMDNTLARFMYPSLANGIGMISSAPITTANNPYNSGNNSNAAFGSHVIDAVVSYPPTSTHYSFQSTCSVPQTTYVPTAGIKLAREQLLSVLAAYTFSPFIKSHVFNTLKVALASSTTQNVVAAKLEPASPMSTGFRPSTVAGLATPRSNSLASLRQSSMSPLPGQVPSTVATPANSAPVPPQMFLQDCVKYANICLWGGYGVQQCMSIGHGSMPLLIKPGQLAQYTGLQPISFQCNGSHISINAPMNSPRGGANTHLTSASVMSPGRRTSTSLPGIATQQAIQEIVSTFPLGAIDVSRALVTREITRSFSYAANLLPAQVGVCVISLLTTSPNQFIWSKHNKNQPFAGMNSLNTLKVVYANNEFASLCGSHSIMSNNLPASGSYASLARSASALTGLRPSTSGGMTASSSSGLGFLSILGRDYQDLFIEDEDKDELLNDITSMKTIHTFARLATGDGSQYTPVVLAMKPVYMRIKPSRHENDKFNMGIGASVQLQGNTNQTEQDIDAEGFDNAGAMYRSSYFSPMFYVCVAIRTNCSPVPYSRPTTPQPKGVTNQHFIAHNYARFSSVPALYEEHKKKDKDRLEPPGIGFHAEVDDSSVEWYMNAGEDDQVTLLSDEHKQYILKSRWAHDSAYLNIFPDVHDVLF